MKAKEIKPVTFCEREFVYFSSEKKRDRELNEYRLRVKRKLADLGKLALPELKKAGMDFTVRTSLHHPYIQNRFAVESLWVYFSLSAKAMEPLKQILGDEFVTDLKTHYNHTLMVVGIDYQGLFVSLKIHPGAWWDGQNLKAKCMDTAQVQNFLDILKPLSHFELKLHQWPNPHKCSNLTIDELKRHLQYFSPGEHWFHVECRIPKENPLAISQEFSDFARSRLLELVPIYKFIAWTPENNFVSCLKKTKEEKI